MYNQGYVPQNQGQQSGSWYAPPPQPRQQQARRSGGSSGKQPPQKPKKKRSLKWQLVKVLIVIVLIAGACAGGYIWKTQNEVKPYMSVFLPNIYVDGISLSGLTWQEGSQKVWEQANAKENNHLHPNRGIGWTLISSRSCSSFGRFIRCMEKGCL